MTQNNNNPMSYLTLPPFLAATAPKDLIPILGATLKPLMDPTLVALDPTFEDMLDILSDFMQEATGMSSPTAVSAMAKTMAMLIEVSGLVIIDDCSDDNSCNGHHGIGISAKGIAFVNAVYSQLGNKPQSLDDKLEDMGNDFLNDWDNTDPPWNN